MGSLFKKNFSCEFYESVDNAFDYISHNLHSPKAADDLMSEIIKCINFAADNPYMYPVCSDFSYLGETRKIVVKNYVILYYIDEDDNSITFFNMFHGSQNYLSFDKP